MTDERFAAALDRLLESVMDVHDDGVAARADVIALYQAKVRECQELTVNANLNRAMRRASEARAEAAERDARRYRWLRDPENINHEAWRTVIHSESTPDEMDAAIDRAAMAAGGNG